MTVNVDYSYESAIVMLKPDFPTYALMMYEDIYKDNKKVGSRKINIAILGTTSYLEQHFTDSQLSDMFDNTFQCFCLKHNLKRHTAEFKDNSALQEYLKKKGL